MIKIKSLNKPINFYGKSWIVQLITREDLKNHLSQKEIDKLTDADMAEIADKLGDALQDNFWTSLEIIIDDRIKPKLKEK